MTPRDRRSDCLPCLASQLCYLFCCCILHRIIRIASTLRCRHVFKTRSCRVPFAFVDRSETNRVFVSLLPGFLTSLHSASTPLVCASEAVPNPNRTFVTVGSGSSPNIYKISPFSLLDSPTYLSRPFDFNRRVRLAPDQKSLLYILPTPRF